MAPRRRMLLPLLALALITGCGAATPATTSRSHANGSSAPTSTGIGATPTATPRATAKPFPQGAWVSLNRNFNPTNGGDVLPLGQLLATDTVTNDVVAVIPQFTSDGSGIYNEETWTWNGSTWTEANSDSPFTSCAMLATARAGVVCMEQDLTLDSGSFGTWLWTGGKWVQEHLSVEPQFDDATPAMAYDPMTGDDVVFNDGDTWSWTGSGNWTPLTGGSQPDVANDPIMGYEPLSSTIVMVGADSNNNPTEYSLINGQWQHQDSSTVPANGNTTSLAMNTDPVTGLLQLTLETGSDNDTQTWVWNGLAWVQLGKTLQTILPLATVDPVKHDLIAFDGNNNMWIWAPAGTPAPPTPTPAPESS